MIGRHGCGGSEQSTENICSLWTDMLVHEHDAHVHVHVACCVVTSRATWCDHIKMSSMGMGEKVSKPHLTFELTIEERNT